MPHAVRPPAGVAVLLPNLPQTDVELVGSQAAAVVCPISPAFGAGAVAGILLTGGCGVLVTEGPVQNLGAVAAGLRRHGSGAGPAPCAGGGWNGRSRQRRHARWRAGA